MTLEARASAMGPAAAGLTVYAAFLALCFLQHGAMLPQALERHTPDDSYYFFQIARNLAAGRGSCFSPGEPTNGYHPLWVWLAAGLQWLTGMSTTAQPIALVALGGAFAALSAAPLVGLLRALGAPDGKARFAAFVYVVNPWTACLALSGMETGLFLLLFFSTFALFARVLASGGFGAAHALGFGCLGGLLMLSRTDSVFFVGAALIHLALRRDRSWQWILGAGTVATAVVAPWLVWSWAHFGTIEQSSSDAIGFVNRASAGGDPWLRAWIGLDFLNLTTFQAAVYPLVRFDAPFSPPLAAWGGVPLAAVLAHLLLRRRWQRPRSGWPLYLVVPALALALYFAFVRQFMQAWHISILVVMGVVAGAWHGSRLGRGGRLAVVAILGLSTLWATRNGLYAFQHGGIDRMLEMARTAPALSGHTDCGRFGYFNDKEVVNLDGVVNNEVLPYLREGRLGDYLVAKGIEAVWIEPSRFAFYNRGMQAEREPGRPAPQAADPRVRGNVDLVRRQADGGPAKVEIKGWVVRADLDSAASLPLVLFLDERRMPLLVYRAHRTYRPALQKSLSLRGARYGGFELTLAAAEVPPAARFLRLGIRAHDGVAWGRGLFPLGSQESASLPAPAGR